LLLWLLYKMHLWLHLLLCSVYVCCPRCCFMLVQWTVYNCPVQPLKNPWVFVKQNALLQPQVRCIVLWFWTCTLWRSFYFHFHILSSSISGYFVFLVHQGIRYTFSCPPGDSSIYVGFGKCTLNIENMTFYDTMPCSPVGG
jgi:hypothetical protein